MIHIPETTYIATSSEDQSIKIWDFSTNRCKFTLNGHIAHIYSLTNLPGT